MKRTTKGFYGLLISGVFSLAIFAGCGGGGGGGTPTPTPTAQTLSGVAAKGAAIVSVTITVKDKNGTTKTGTTGSDGKYEVDVAGMTVPFLMRVPAGTGYLYSVATATGTANIHPFTDLIIRNWYKVKGADVETDFAGGALSQVPTASEIDTIEAVIRNILSSWLSNVGLSASTFNLITSSFSADTTGFDKVLDNTGVVIDATGNVTVTTADPTTGIESTMVTTTISTNLTTADTTKPSDPTGLAAIPASTTSIVLVWNASTDNIGVAGYNIYKGGSKVGSSPYPVYSDTGLTSGNYCYQVEAFDGVGNISANKSIEVCATPAADATAPDAPTGLTATAASSSQINLSWTASTSTDVVGYAIYRGGTKITAVTGTSYSDTGLSSSTQYSYEVKAFDGAGNSSTVVTASATTLAGILSAPTGVSASAGDGQVTMTWTAVSAATSYNIYWSTTTGVTKTGGTKITGATSPYIHTGRTNGTTYYYVVTAVNISGESVESTQVSATPAAPTSGVGTKFPIATTTTVAGSATGAGQELGFSAAYDGTNYLVGIQGDATAGNNVTAQLMDGSGNLIGSRISTGRTGGPPIIAFNGTNYLMVWSDDATGPDEVIYGEVLSKTGQQVKAPFAISVTVGNLEWVSIVCVGARCSVIWDDKTANAVYGRDIDSAGGFLTNEYTIAAGSGGGPFAACDANGNCMAVYDTGTEIRASIKGPTINKNTFVIATKAPVTAGCTDHNPSPVVFDGTNYLVVWNDHSDCAAVPAWDILAQRVDVNGNKVGAAFQVNSASTQRAAIPFMAFDGTNFLVSWTDGRNDANRDGICDSGEGTCGDVYGQYISKAGVLVGSEFVINNDAGDQLGMVTGFNNGKYLVLINTGVTWTAYQGGGDVYGVFVTP